MSELGLLSQWVAEAQGNVPDLPRHAAVRTIANSVCLMVSAGNNDVVSAASAAMLELGRSGPVPVLGTGTRLTPGDAALVNGVAAHVEDFDDTHLRTVIHPGCAVVPAVLAASRRTAGAAVVDAVAVGVEVMLRIGLALGPTHFDRGWHLTSSTGRFGAAAGVARLRGLDAGSVRAALSIASVQVAGLQAALGSGTKSYHAGKAAADGFEAAGLAELGVAADVDDDPLFGPGGTASITADRPDAALAVEELGQRWELLDNAFKPYACGIVSHPAIDAGIALRDHVDPWTVDRIEIEVAPVVLDVMGVHQPADSLQSKFSVYHALAVGLLDGTAGPGQFTDSRATDPVVRDLRARIAVHLDPGMPRDACRARALVGGDWHEVVIEHATASAHRPMTDSQLQDKCRNLVEPALGHDRGAALVTQLFDLERVVAVEDLLPGTSSHAPKKNT